MYRIIRIDNLDQAGEYIEDRNPEVGNLYYRIIEVIEQSENLNDLGETWDAIREQGSLMIVAPDGEIIFSGRG